MRVAPVFSELPSQLNFPCWSCVSDTEVIVPSQDLRHLPPQHFPIDNIAYEPNGCTSPTNPGPTSTLFVAAGGEDDDAADSSRGTPAAADGGGGGGGEDAVSAGRKSSDDAAASASSPQAQAGASTAGGAAGGSAPVVSESVHESSMSRDDLLAQVRTGWGRGGDEGRSYILLLSFSCRVFIFVCFTLQYCGGGRLFWFLAIVQGLSLKARNKR